jgi:3-hydroxybutyryl-CoA dehydrogenase
MMTDGGNTMRIGDIKRILIVGAGNMGQQIGTLCAVHGFEVVMYDVNQDMLDNAFKRIDRLLKYFVTSKKITQREADKSLTRIQGTIDMEEAAADVDLISESVPEDPDLKKKIFSQFNKLCPKHTIFTTNSSAIVPSIFARATGRPGKLVALHFHDLRTTDIVDVMAHPGTSEETFDLVREFAIRIGQVPIILRKESAGYVFNSMLTALFHASQTLVANGVTSVEETDRAWMGVTHMSMGPFGLMDSVGIDTVWKVTDYWAKKVNDKQGKKNARFLKKYVDEGLLGQKTRKGFYSYPQPAFLDPGFIKGDMK